MQYTEILRRYRRSISPPYRPKGFLALGSTLLLVLCIPAIIILLFNYSTLGSQAQTPASFTFTAAGDYSGSATRTTAVLSGMNPEHSGADFNLALGDLSYGSKTPETAWCDYVKSNVGETFPFELIPGNHEDDGPAGNTIDNFEQCLPHRLGPITGRYSREYYFDYPSVDPLARFITISPHLSFPDEGTYTYTAGNSHYTWVADAIDTARSAGIRWIVVSMHENCITMGKKSCSIGVDLFNLLLDRHVDLILQGHDHNYQRSKQLALSPTCIGIVPGSYNPDCVSDDGSDDIYTKGAGTIVNIVGTGGIGNYDINTSDSEAGYFARWNGVNADPTVGFLQATVTDTRMSLSFHSMYGPVYSDSFIIQDTSVPISPTPTPTVDPFAPTPTDTPTATPTPTLAAGTVTLTSQVSTSADDAEEAISSRSVSLSSSDLELGADGSRTQIVGMRFPAIAIPQGATITNAFIEFEVDEVSTAATAVTISGQASDNPDPFTATTGDISSRPKTSRYVAWNGIPAWDTVHAKQQTPDISALIGEIITRPGWAWGNSIVIMIQGTGRRTAESYNGEPANSAKLVLSYSTGPTPTPTDTPIPTPTPTVDPFAATLTETPMPIPTDTPIPSLTILASPVPAVLTLNPIADSSVKENAVATNFGSATKLEVDGKGPLAITYLTFDFSPLDGKTIQWATLRIRITNGSNNTQVVKHVGDTIWGESSITYTNRPPLGTTITSFIGGPSGVWREVAIPASAMQASTGQLFSLGIDSAGSNGLDFYSRERLVEKPVLTITYY